MYVAFYKEQKRHISVPIFQICISHIRDNRGREEDGGKSKQSIGD